MTCAHDVVGHVDADVAVLAPDAVPAGPSRAGAGILVVPVLAVLDAVADLREKKEIRSSGKKEIRSYGSHDVWGRTISLFIYKRYLSIHLSIYAII